jgi:hypothetical protein
METKEGQGISSRRLNLKIPQLKLGVLQEALDFLFLIFYFLFRRLNLTLGQVQDAQSEIENIENKK